MDGIELLCFQMISAAGTARSCSIEAIREAKKGNFKKAEELIKESKSQFLNAHEVHNKLLQHNTNGENTNSLILVMHAEDQLMSAEMFEILAKEFIDTYKRLFNLEQKFDLNFK
ncbi:PTS lactose/cellobiose transporter subunit IIA [Clostridium lacusfryxellense]|uniref:PTS lactose/cellobiose transporter subunit IIA n=1 Tax=Clostridium lacusfryxellense TaxID=205328 RepID=UPI001C0CD4BC|nr:PTS lactose/cellobiose transporter subunit IIA [Clostridium lacusfryxellense]MBU3111298.1 PTS lactose/cellobiose transporter subunit IIA [Clostridium lacusfryxellense]